MSSNTSSMDMELELGYEEEEEKQVIEIENEKEEEDEIEELEEMTTPMLSCRIDADGKKHHEIVVDIYDDDLNGFKNRLEMIDPCSICFLPFSTQGNHRICCLPCGHLYGLSCIQRWLQTSSDGKCPQCKTSCAYKDVIRLYASRASAYQKKSSTRHFPFTKQGLIEFKKHERSRRVDAKKMHAQDHKRLVDVLEHQSDVVNQRVLLMSQLEDLLERCEELKHDVASKRRYDALGRRYDALGRRADVLEQRVDVLERWLSESKLALKFFTQMYKEHVALQKKNTKPCTGVLQAPTCHKH